MKDSKISSIFIRYLVLILIAIPNLFIFYFIFTPLTIYPLYFLFNLFYDVTLINHVLFVSSFPIEIIPACVAGAAYYLLLMFNLSTPGMEAKRRIKLIGISFLTLLIINITRIFILGILFVNESGLFDILHYVLWYIGSTVFVVGIWFYQVKHYKIKKIPFYSDLKYLFKLTKRH